VVLFRDGQITRRSPAKRARGHGWRWQTASLRPAGPAHLNVDAVAANQRAARAAAMHAAMSLSSDDAVELVAHAPQLPAMLTAHHSLRPAQIDTALASMVRLLSRQAVWAATPPRCCAPPHHNPNRIARILMLQTLHRRLRRQSPAASRASP
jgi:hypothetical protein